MKYRSTKKSNRRGNARNTFSNPRIPADYPWKVLTSLLSDLGDFLPLVDAQCVAEIARKRDIPTLIELSKRWGLQSMNLQRGGTIVEKTVRYQLAMLLKRFPFESEKATQRAAALEKFKFAESACASFNNIEWRALASPLDDDVVSVYTYAREFVLKVLDVCPEFVEVVEWSRHGPGATLSTSHGFNSSYSKYEGWPYDVTKAAAGHARCLITMDKRWLGALEDDYRDVMEIPKHFIINQQVFWTNILHIVPGNVVTFVPKDVQTERTIAIEPVLNLYLQLGVDGFIRRRLTSFGVDLNSQEKNIELARLGSIDGSFATLDLKAASDSIATKLCHLLLPPMWYRYLLDLRSPVGTIGDEVISYEKISSMGNGFTFALESLIFASVIYGVQRHFSGRFDRSAFAVFGDDLVIENSLATYLVYYLRKFGFTTNSDKTFIQGPIRESCGSDWFRGLLIRPVFITEYPSTTKQLFSARNRLRRKLEVAWGLSDSAVVSTFDKWCPEKELGLIGPPTDQEFDTYRHMSYPFGKKFSSGQYWPFLRLIVRPQAFVANKFLFRKIMAQLRSADDPPRFWEGLKGKGGCFDVTRRGRVITSVVKSRAYSWPETYLT